jgi:hypothetical protein
MGALGVRVVALAEVEPLSTALPASSRTEAGGRASVGERR